MSAVSKLQEIKNEGPPDSNELSERKEPEKRKPRKSHRKDKPSESTTLNKWDEIEETKEAEFKIPPTTDERRMGDVLYGLLPTEGATPTKDIRDMRDSE